MKENEKLRKYLQIILYELQISKGICTTIKMRILRMLNSF